MKPLFAIAAAAAFCASGMSAVITAALVWHLLQIIQAFGG